MNRESLKHYIRLTRLNRPIGIYLLLWPTLSALWIAAEGFPEPKVFIIFLFGVIFMRSAGCIINDYADRKIDGHVERTKNRPLPLGLITEKEALFLFFGLILMSFLLVLLTNWRTIQLSFVAVLLAACYPFMKRYTYLPQVVLGAAFAWAIPMAFSALEVPLNNATWLLFLATVLWTVAYDTLYAMVDRNDDLKLGVRSTAILFGQYDRLIVGLIQLLTLISWSLLGLQAELGLFWWIGVALATALFGFQQWLIRNRERDGCFRAFLNNHWVGLLLFTTLIFHYATSI